jgi:hypothetical protein
MGLPFSEHQLRIFPRDQLPKISDKRESHGFSCPAQSSAEYAAPPGEYHLRLDNRPPNLEELTHLCVVALQIYYDGKCPEECLEARARDFAAWHLARLGHDPRAGQRE